METPIGILAAATYLPPTRKPVSEILAEEHLDDTGLATQVDFRKDIGIEAVHLADAEPPSSLGLKAARAAVAQSGIDPAEIDLVLDFTSIPEDYVAPTWSAAGLVQHALGAHRAVATAVNTGGCASYHVALKTALAWLRASPSMTTALLFAGDKAPPNNHTYYPITVVCDGGSAVVLRKGLDQQVILAVEVATLGQLHDVWYMQGLARRNPDDPIPYRWLHMRSDIQKFNEGVIPVNLFMFRKVMRGALRQAGLTMADVNYFVYPTFSTWDQRSFCQGFQIPETNIYLEGLARHGHLQENDMVLNYVDARNEGRLQAGDVVMVTTNGAGFTWGAALIRQ